MYRRNPLVLELHETIDRYMKSVLQKQHAFEQFFLFVFIVPEKGITRHQKQQANTNKPVQ